MSYSVSASDVADWVRAYAQRVHEEKDRLTELDAAIGDADHGANMDRGLTAAVAALAQGPSTAPGQACSKVGMTLVSTIGGASGPLFGTFFLRLGSALGDLDQVAPAAFAAALRAGLAGVVARGKAQAGDKTMYDALAPAVDAQDAALAEGAPWPTALQRASAAAEVGCAATTPMLARRGRASYLGERSTGHQDPGAASAALLVAAAVGTLAPAPPTPAAPDDGLHGPGDPGAAGTEASTS